MMTLRNSTRFGDLIRRVPGVTAIAATLLIGAAAKAETSHVVQALAVLDSLQSGDPAAITANIDPDHYRQHNLMFPDGRAPLLGALPMLRDGGTKWHAVRAFADGDYVFVHSDAHFMGADRVAFDVFRFDGGRIVEHWDNIQDKAGPNPSGHGMTDGATEIADLDKTDANKALVRAMLDDVLIAGHFDKAPHYISTTTYVQHNPHVADGLEGLQKAGPMLAKFRYLSVEKLLGAGNFVLAMSHVSFDGADSAAYDLFRVADGHIVEHWDVVAPIPPRTEWRNQNGKF